MKKKWFAFHVFLISFSSVMVFLYYLALIAVPFITVPGMGKETVYGVIITAIAIGWLLYFLGVRGMWKATKNDLNVEENKKI